LRFRVGIIGLALAFAGEAAAGPCTSSYTTDKMLEDLIATEDFLRSYDFVAAGGAAQVLLDGIRCLNASMPSQVAGRTYRAIGGGLTQGGDAKEGFNWLVTAATLEPGFEYGLEDVATDHPLRSVYADAAAQSNRTKVKKEGFDYFVAGEHYVDGRELSEPKASVGHPHLFQSKIDGVLSGAIINGNQFPEEVLSTTAPGSDSVAVETTTKPVKEKKTGGGGPNVPLLATGGVGVIASALTFVMSRGASKKFDEGTTLEEIEQYRNSTNTLSTVSGVALGVGLSTLTVSFVVDGAAPTPMVNIRF
jgi:hypothetical protein